MTSISQASEAVAVLRPAIPRRYIRSQECFVVVALDTKNRPLGRPIMASLGTLASVEVHPRDVFRHAVKRNAASVVVAHNHPSGDPEPSADDKIITDRLKRAGAVLGIPVLDHIVIAGDRWVSFADRGML